MGTQSVIRHPTPFFVRVFSVVIGLLAALGVSYGFVSLHHFLELGPNGLGADADTMLFIDIVLAIAPIMLYGFLLAPHIWYGGLLPIICTVADYAARLGALLSSFAASVLLAGGMSYVLMSLKSDAKGNASSSDGLMIFCILLCAGVLLLYALAVVPWLWKMTYVDQPGAKKATAIDAVFDNEDGSRSADAENQDPYGLLAYRRSGHNGFILTPTLEGITPRFSELEAFERRHGLLPSGNPQLDAERDRTIRELSAPRAQLDSLGNEIESERPTITDGYLSPFFTGQHGSESVRPQAPVVVGKVKELPPERPTVAGGFRAAEPVPQPSTAIVRLHDLVQFPLSDGTFEQRQLLMRTETDGVVVEVYSGVYLDPDELDDAWDDSAMAV